MYFKKKLLIKIITLIFTQIIMLSTLNADSPLLVELTPHKQNISDGSILVKITNNSNKPIKILRWNTPLEDRLNANIFKIEHNRKSIIYKGRILKRAKPKDEDYTLFESGESRTVSVNLSTYYKMFQEGNYTISYRGTFNYLNENLKHKSLKKSKKSKSRIELYFIPTESKEITREKLTAKFNGCTQREVDILNKAHDSALVIAKVASDAMKSTSANTKGKRYITWFGRATVERQNLVTLNFSKIYDALDNKRIHYDCNPCEEDGVFAYVYPEDAYNMHLCDSFWSADLLGTDSQSGTLVHELSHFLVISGTIDYIYGQDEAKLLAKTSPENAINNADNYEYFAENSPSIDMTEGSGNNDFDNAREISNFPLIDTISTPESKNMYKIIPSKSVEYTLYTTGSLDTYGILYDENRNILSKNDDISASNYNFMIHYNLIPNRTYFLEIGAYKREVGEFTIHQEYKKINQTIDIEDNSGKQSSSEVPSFNLIGMFLFMFLTSLVAYREIKKSI